MFTGNARCYRNMRAGNKQQNGKKLTKEDINEGWSLGRRGPAVERRASVDHVEVCELRMNELV